MNATQTQSKGSKLYTHTHLYIYTFKQIYEHCKFHNLTKQYIVTLYRNIYKYKRLGETKMRYYRQNITVIVIMYLTTLEYDVPWQTY